MGRHNSKTVSPPLSELTNCATGIHGLVRITGRGIPRGRPTLYCGGAGSGKPLMSMQFVVRGIEEHGEPGVFMCFEEREGDLAEVVASMGFDPAALITRKKLVLDQVIIERDQTIGTGEYNLDGWFIRRGAAIDAVGISSLIDTWVKADCRTHVDGVPNKP